MSRDLINNMLGFSGFDGDRISMKGHPVSLLNMPPQPVAGGCIQKWHRIKKGKELSGQEIQFLVGLIMAWIAGQIFTKNHTEQHGTYT